MGEGKTLGHGLLEGERRYVASDLYLLRTRKVNEDNFLLVLLYVANLFDTLLFRV